MATLPAAQNSVELENYLLDAAAGARNWRPAFEFVSTLIEERLRETGPAWVREATVLQRVDNYLGSGLGFAYLQAALGPSAVPVNPS